MKGYMPELIKKVSVCKTKPTHVFVSAGYWQELQDAIEIFEMYNMLEGYVEYDN